MDLMPQLTPELERAIVTPHEHEGPDNPPVWIVWVVRRSPRDNSPEFPSLDSVSLTEAMARYHTRAALESPSATVYVERIPAHHRFGSSLGHWQIAAHQALWKERTKHREGD